jgi:hypothetical protein
MDHATTVIDTVGGYTGEKRKMIRVIIYQVETAELRTKIAELDPKAFVSFTQAKTINGEGFEPFIIPKKPSKNRLHRISSHETQYEEAEKLAQLEAEEKSIKAKEEKIVSKEAALKKPEVKTPAKKSEPKANDDKKVGESK